MIYNTILKKYWGYDNFRGIQREIIDSIGAGRDTLGLMPTGGGKSIAFQVPALAREGLCIVITPLIALMKDQVANLRSRGIKATAIYSGMRTSDVVAALENCIFGGYKFLYISPERLTSELFLKKISKVNVTLITVDEAHCISQWGHDFRPAYREVGQLRTLFPGVPVLALTATATPDVVSDIQQQLGFATENCYSMSFERKNLVYVVRRTENKPQELLHILDRMPGSAIIYTLNRKKTKEICDFLVASGVTADYYHAGLSPESKDAKEEAWKSGRVRVMVSTNAFGMGIDKPDVRLVVHVDLPSSIESYFQEAGRAGRDGETAYAVTLLSRTDKQTVSRRLSDNYPPQDFIRSIYDEVCYYYSMALGDGLDCTFEFSLGDFCKQYRRPTLQTDSALRLLTRMGYIEYVEEMEIVDSKENLELKELRRKESNRKYTKSFLALALPVAYLIIDALGTVGDEVYFHILGDAASDYAANSSFELTFFLLAIFSFIWIKFVKKDMLFAKRGRAVYLGGACETLGQIFYMAVMFADYEIGMPIISSYCVVSLLWSRIFLKEKLSVKHYLTIALTFVGIVLLGIFSPV